MKADTRTEAEVLATIDKNNEAFARKSIEDVLELFALDPDVVLMGSERAEVATDRDQLNGLLRRIFRRRETYSWEWKRRSVSAAGSVAWLTADALVSTYTNEKKVTTPYRMTVVLEKRNGKWFWMQYHGSEPVDGHG